MESVFIGLKDGSKREIVLEQFGSSVYVVDKHSGYILVVFSENGIKRYGNIGNIGLPLNKYCQIKQEK